MRYCVDFVPNNADWIGYSADSDSMASDSFSCGRGWVVIQSGEFSALSSSNSPSQFTAQEVAALKYQAANPSPFNMTLEEGALVAGAVLGVWGIGVGIRELRRLFSGGESLE